MKKLYSMFVFAVAALPAFAAWDGTSAPFTTGDGSETNPYLIENEQQFEYFRQSVTDGTTYSGQFVKLAADLDMGAGAGRFTAPVGSYESYSIENVQYEEVKPFMGVFDGDYHTIDHLAVVQPNPEGTFGCGLFAAGGVSTVIRNLRLGENVSIGDGTCDDTGGLMAISVGARIENCSFNGGIDGGGVETGGFVGYARQGTVISGCLFSGFIEAHSFVGGIAGSMDGASVIENCYFTGEISAENGMWVGGIAGWIKDKCQINSCYSIGKIVASVGSTWARGMSPVCGEFEGSTGSANFYVEELCGCKPIVEEGDVKAVTLDELKSAEVLAALNGTSEPAPWIKSETTGLPMLAWELKGSTSVSSPILSDKVGITAVSGAITIAVDEPVCVTVFDASGRVVTSLSISSTATIAPSVTGICIVAVNGAETHVVAKVVL